jgi:two-component system NarL family response regulator
MHDTMGQVLSYINAQIQSIRDLLAQAQPARIDIALGDMLAATREAQANIHEFILGVKVTEGMTREQTSTSTSADLIEQGFFATLEHYLLGFTQLSGIQTSLEIESALRAEQIAPVVTLHLLRIVQEALSNVRKHARASQVQISFDWEDDQIRGIIRDNGQGFDMAVLSDESTHYGIQSMRGRAESIGGSLHIDSRPGQGTRITVQVPRPDQQTHDTRYPIRVMLVDDNALFLQGLFNLLTTRGFVVVGMARNGSEALQQARSLRPDVILMDIQMPDSNGLAATRQIKAELPACQIVMLTLYAEDEYLFAAIKSGASGYLLKNLDADDLTGMLLSIAQGEAPLSPGLAARILRELARPIERSLPADQAASDDDDEWLSAQERQILTMVTKGMTYKQIGNSLGFSERSIKYRMADIIQRLQLKNRAEAIDYARQRMKEGKWEPSDPE